MSASLNTVTSNASTVNLAEEKSEYFTLAELLQCPACNHDTLEWNTSDKNHFQCDACELDFPSFISDNAIIPWIFPQPQQTMLEWKARINGFLHLNDAEQKQLKHALKDKRLSKAANKRIRNIKTAKTQYVEQVQNLLEIFNLHDVNFSSSSPLNSVYAEVAKSQGLLSYHNNVYRDWCWENGENQHLLDCIDSVVQQCGLKGKVLTIGAGAGRLPYDIHCKYSPELSLLLDINPLLSVIASKMIQGEEIELYEFPIAPLNKDSFAVLQKCRAPSALEQNIIVMLANGLQPPFKNNSIDAVITPWLIDILPQNFRDTVLHMNRILDKGGIWVNTGSLEFAYQDPTWCYAENEILDVLEKNGFEVITSNRQTIQYLNSPISAHGREEKVFNFSARKIKNGIAPQKKTLIPEWISNTNKAIPNHPGYPIEASKHLLQAQVIGAIDGNLSIEQISHLVSQQYNTSLNESEQAVRRIMIDLHDANL